MFTTPLDFVADLPVPLPQPLQGLTNSPWLEIAVRPTGATSEFCTDGQDIVQAQLSFGNTYQGGSHLTQTTLSRYPGRGVWVGTLVSSASQ